MLPPDIVFAAQADLAEAANAMSFKMKRSYADCAAYLQKNDPWLACASAIIANNEGAANDAHIICE